jgi:uncharacterized membrane protein
MSIHPLIVHFPIALLLTSILADLIALFRPESPFKGAAFFLLVLGVIGAVASGVSGHRAAEALAHLPDLQAPVEQHEDLATGTIWLFIFLLLLRLTLLIKHRFLALPRTAYLVASLVAGGVLVAAAYSGGRLVFEHGAGVKPVMERATTPEK